MLSLYELQYKSHKWVGLYMNLEDELPEWVVCVGYLKVFRFNLMEISTTFMGTFLKPNVGSQYYTFIKVRPNVRNVEPPMAFLRWMSRVRVGGLARGNAQTQFTMFFQKLDQLFLDPGVMVVVQKVHHSWYSWPSSVGSGLLVPKRPLRSQSLVSGGMKFPLQIS